MSKTRTKAPKPEPVIRVRHFFPEANDQRALEELARLLDQGIRAQQLAERDRQGEAA